MSIPNDKCTYKTKEGQEESAGTESRALCMLSKPLPTELYPQP